MLNKLKEAEARFVHIEEEISRPEVATDPETFKSLMKERKLLSPII